MVRNRVLPFLSVILLATLPTASFAQDARAVLASVVKAMGAENLKTLHYSGSGSSYVITPGPAPATGWPHTYLKSYVRDLNLESAISRLHGIRVQGTPPADQTMNHSIDANSPWSTQYQFWLTPYGFLKGAIAGSPSLTTKTVFGSAYRVITFTPPGGQPVSAYLSDKDLIEKVETRIGDKNDVPVEALYRDYKDVNGVQFPMMITEKQGGELSLLVMVNEVKAGK